MATKKTVTSATQKAQDGLKVAVGTRIEASEYLRLERFCEARNLSISDFAKTAISNELNRLAGSIPRVQPTLEDVVSRIDALARQIENSESTARLTAETVQSLAGLFAEK